MDGSDAPQDNRRCSFCGRGPADVDHLVPGPGVEICDGCVELCAESIEFERRSRDTGTSAELPRPRVLRSQLDEFVVGQDEAKRALSVAVYNHYKRIRAGRDDRDEITKSNILLLGPTGSGKTLLAHTLARILRVPFAVVDATGLTEAGYVGEDVESMLAALVRAADHDVAAASRGIVYIDEIDKIARRGMDGTARDVSGEGVQQSLLRVLEGTVVTIDPKGSSGVAAERSRSRGDGVRLDTTDVLFVLGGAFPRLPEIVSARLRRNTIGFRSGNGSAAAAVDTTTDALGEVTPEDLVEFGMIPEFVGRLPVIGRVSPLERGDLLRILVEPRNALVRQYSRLFRMDGIDLHFEQDALEAVADRALARGTGARGLRSIMESVLQEAMYDLPSVPGVASATVTRAAVEGTGMPVIAGADGAAVPWEIPATG